ncbi:hypothetical protein PISL3812_04623 [Talaromyces islandicus]|uniref:Uncharacterized protein n=1 Tax=Talaromyces islandicus TaxID=28573 RepID=A0A0U1LW13_TALIS|nr:hypothetical protein PISL3812_04623 [Talaromyces islandicus]
MFAVRLFDVISFLASLYIAMARTLVLISGGNQGLGYEAAKSLLSQSDNYHIIIGGRVLAKATAAAESLRSVHGGASLSAIQLDITDNTSVDAAAAQVDSQYGRLDILVNNAAIYLINREPVRDALRDSLATNVTGTASLTEAMLPLLQKSQSPRIVFVSTSMGSLNLNTDPSFPSYGDYAMEYRVTKAALNMLLVLYSNKLKNIKVIGVDPGFCATNVIGDPEQLRKMGAMEPEVGAQFIASVVKGDNDEHAGRLVGMTGIIPW